ncbi:VOC family protein [Cerasicoccus fimbriatus]|uniref:VOC family protein n=1 Tax=Cerasicoccus fimbriatus TaxID=3014554 RepID=UPI0022B3CE0B|nr:VOC family protein [Cerasicoccus sp. TK19100]
MFDHIGFFVNDITRSAAFYEACLAPLGVRITQRQPHINAVIISGESEYPFIWMGETPPDGDYHGSPVSKDATRPIHLAFKADSKEAVDAFHAAGLAHGGKCNGQPEDDGYDYYAAYLIDPDGNNIEAGFHL